MKVATKLRLLTLCCILALLAACGMQYSPNRNCTRNMTACSEPPSMNCCTTWGDIPDPDELE